MLAQCPLISSLPLYQDLQHHELVSDQNLLLSRPSSRAVHLVCSSGLLIKYVCASGYDQERGTGTTEDLIRSEALVELRHWFSQGLF